ncbi:MAG: DUF1684 domain-containing protein [Chloroflexota bacterium]
MAAYEDEILAWRRARDESLRAEDGWLALAGLFWLRQGENRIGADASGEVVLPADLAPPYLGTLTVSSGHVTLEPAPDTPLTADGEPAGRIALRADTTGSPTILRHRRLKMVLIERAGRFGLRVWDSEHAHRRSFPGRVWFPVDSHYRVVARFEAYDAARPIAIDTMLGEAVQEDCLGRVAFVLDGIEGSLEALAGDDGGLFLIFRDATTGATTYPGGRYLTTEAPSDDQVELDFNRAYNPPCAFTPYATCPLPPKGNTLPHRIEAGERFVKDWPAAGSAPD